MDQDERRLWVAGDVECVMITCCSGAELQVRRGGNILVRELYPMKSDLYERARDLRSEYEQPATTLDADPAEPAEQDK